jgi:hypothetical protein
MAAISLAMTAPAQAQYCPPRQWGCYQQQPFQQEQAQPSKSERGPAVRRRERVIVKDWRSMSQDNARKWIREQAACFCSDIKTAEVIEKFIETLDREVLVDVWERRGKPPR